MKVAINDTPIDFDIVNDKIRELNVQVVGKATIREIKRLVDNIESASGKKFIRMEMVNILDIVLMEMILILELRSQLKQFSGQQNCQE